MIKTQVLVKRKAGMTREAFADYWLGTHAAITAKFGGIRRQTISIIRSDLQRADTPWDGLANAWWDDAAAIASARRGDAFRAMLEDEENFVDVSERRPLVVVEINPLAPKVPPEPHPDRIKIVNPLFKLDALSYQAFSDYWRGPHAALNNALPHMNAYIQNHVHPDFRNAARACDGIAESWFNSMDEIRELLRSEANARLREDEAKLIKPGSLLPMVCREYRTI
jgi:uncharacterized protein (TIGR02118 family)